MTIQQFILFNANLEISIVIGIINYLFLICVDWSFEYDKTTGNKNLMCWYYQWLLTLPIWIAKPLGMCLYCFGFYTNFIIFVIVKYNFVNIDWLFFIISYLITFFILKKHENKN